MQSKTDTQIIPAEAVQVVQEADTLMQAYENYKITTA